MNGDVGGVSGSDIEGDQDGVGEPGTKEELGAVESGVASSTQIFNTTTRRLPAGLSAWMSSCGPLLPCTPVQPNISSTGSYQTGSVSEVPAHQGPSNSPVLMPLQVATLDEIQRKQIQALKGLTPKRGN